MVVEKILFDFLPSELILHTNIKGFFLFEALKKPFRICNMNFETFLQKMVQNCQI